MLNRLVRLVCSLPQLSADLLLEMGEWQGVYILSKKEAFKKTPKFNSVVRLIVRLHGFLGRKGDERTWSRNAVVYFSIYNLFC